MLKTVFLHWLYTYKWLHPYKITLINTCFTIIISTNIAYKWGENNVVIMMLKNINVGLSKQHDICLASQF